MKLFVKIYLSHPSHSFNLGQFGVDLQAEITDARTDCPYVESSQWDEMDDSASSIVDEIGSF